MKAACKLLLSPDPPNQVQQPRQVCDKTRQMAAAAVWAFPDHGIWNSIRASNSLSFWQVQRKEGFNKDQETPRAKAETTIDFKALESSGKMAGLAGRRHGFESLGHEFEFLLCLC